MRDTEIHHTEILLTLDYLLNYTNEDHPATQKKIIDYAQQYNLSFTPDRERIGDCLRFLYSLSEKFKNREDFPFQIGKTDANKFYLIRKGLLTDKEVLSILTALKNDKYIKEEKEETVTKKIIDMFCNEFNRETFLKALSNADKKIKKNTSTQNRKVIALERAYATSTAVKVNVKVKISQREVLKEIEKKRKTNETIDIKKLGYKNLSIFCRVAMLREFNNELYVCLLPLKKYRIFFVKVSEIEVPRGKERDLFLSDDKSQGRLDELFTLNNQYAKKKYGSLKKYLESQIIALGGPAELCSFYCDIDDYQVVKKSYEKYFNADFAGIFCKDINIKPYNAEEKIASKIKNVSLNDSEIECIKFEEKKDKTEDIKYVVVNVIMNKLALVDWVLNDFEVANKIEIVTPRDINNILARKYSEIQERFEKRKIEEPITTRRSPIEYA